MAELEFRLIICLAAWHSFRYIVQVAFQRLADAEENIRCYIFIFSQFGEGGGTDSRHLHHPKKRTPKRETAGGRFFTGFFKPRFCFAD